MFPDHCMLYQSGMTDYSEPVCQPWTRLRNSPELTELDNICENPRGGGTGI
jgi:hypothetical protein